MARVSLTKKYSGSTLGVIWAFVRPTMYYLVYWFAISVGIRGSRELHGIPFAFWLMPGITAWFFIADVINISGVSIIKNKHLVTKMVYPKETIPTSEVLANFFVHLVMLGVVTVIFLVLGFGLSIYYLQLPYYILCCLSFCLALSFLLSALTAISKDFRHALKSGVTLLFWLTPILWAIEKIGSPLKQIVKLNPLTYLVSGYRNCFVNEVWFFQEWRYALYFWGVTIVLALLAAFVFNKLKDEFADVI